MVDEIFDRMYQRGRGEMNAGIDRAFSRLSQAIGRGLEAMHRIEWSAPWHGKENRTQCH